MSGDGGVAALLAAADGPDGDAALRMALSLGERGERAVIDALPTMSVVAARRAVRALAATGRAAAERPLRGCGRPASGPATAEVGAWG